MKVCTRCKKNKPISEFGWRETKGNYQSSCKSCQREISKEWYANNREKQVQNSIRNSRKYRDLFTQKLFEYLKEHACVDCGQKNPVMLEFDHVRGTKTNEISNLLGNRAQWDKIEQEIAKCDVRCANCHRLVTAKRANQRMYRLWKKDNAPM